MGFFNWNKPPNSSVENLDEIREKAREQGTRTFEGEPSKEEYGDAAIKAHVENNAEAVKEADVATQMAYDKISDEIRNKKMKQIDEAMKDPGRQDWSGPEIE